MYTALIVIAIRPCGDGQYGVDGHLVLGHIVLKFDHLFRPTTPRPKG